MKEIPLYSLVIFPSPEQSYLIKCYKQLLKNSIGWFGSCNSEAHITIINFKDENTLSFFLEHVKEFCKTTHSQKVIFNNWSSFGEQTFYISPDLNSQLYLNNLIRNLHQYLGFKINNYNAHLTIARGLDLKKMTLAYKLFENTKINFEFNCDGIYIREFNNKTKQYSNILEKISFKQ